MLFIYYFRTSLVHSKVSRYVIRRFFCSSITNSKRGVEEASFSGAKTPFWGMSPLARARAKMAPCTSGTAAHGGVPGGFIEPILQIPAIAYPIIILESLYLHKHHRKIPIPLLGFHLPHGKEKIRRYFQRRYLRTPELPGSSIKEPHASEETHLLHGAPASAWSFPPRCVRGCFSKGSGARRCRRPPRFLRETP